MNDLSDEQLEECAGTAQRLLRERREQRKADTIQTVRATLQAAGLTVRDLLVRRRAAAGEDSGRRYRAGYRYQNPEHPSQVWNGRGKKPAWLRALEAREVAPVQVQGLAADVSPARAAKTK